MRDACPLVMEAGCLRRRVLEKKSEGAAGMRGLPQVQRLLEMAQAGLLAQQAPRPVLIAALRTVLDQARADLLRADPGASPPPAEELLRRAECAIAAAEAPVLRRAINATGIVLHTNLGP